MMAILWISIGAFVLVACFSRFRDDLRIRKLPYWEYAREKLEFHGLRLAGICWPDRMGFCSLDVFSFFGVFFSLRGVILSFGRIEERLVIGFDKNKNVYVGLMVLRFNALRCVDDVSIYDWEEYPWGKPIGVGEETGFGGSGPGTAERQEDDENGK